MTANAIEAVGLSKRFRVPTERRTSFKERVVRGSAPKPKEFWALKDATFSVPRGASLGLIGHNGSGKSTALKVLAGIYRPTSGQVSVSGSVSALLEVGAGFHPELTGRENIRLNATILGFTNREIDRLMGAIIEFADIGDHIDAPIKHYSSGMHVRLGFAVAVMVRPEILLVDEVIAVGDEEFQRKCYDYLYDLRRAGTSMIVVSHGLGQITDLCDQAVWLEHGEVRGFGESRTVVRAYLDDVNHREVARTTPDKNQAPRPGG
jgi:lipopolysaccharide transport system ATP-binding protein